MVKGIASIEVFMKDKFIFPYDYLEEAKYELTIPNKYNVYYVLKGHRLTINSIKLIDKYHFSVEIEDVVKKEKISILFNVCTFLQLPDMDYVELTIQNNKSMLQIDFNERGMQYLNKVEPEYVERNREIIEMYGCMRLQLHVKVLCELYYKFQGEETVDEYELLYVGQSKKDNIFDRLYEHNTIPEIIRYLNREDDKEKYDIYIMVTGVHVKFFEQFDINKYKASIVTSNTLEEDFIINEGLISKSEVINIAEAMLILFFKPTYNLKLKNTKKPEELTAYRIFNNCLINPITYSLDLYFEDINKKIILRTDAVTVEFKQNLLKCEFNDEGKLKEIVHEHLPLDIYL